MSTLTVKTRKDFHWLYHFLPSWNRVAMMPNVHLSAGADMELNTDESGSHGFWQVTSLPFWFCRSLFDVGQALVWQAGFIPL